MTTAPVFDRPVEQRIDPPVPVWRTPAARIWLRGALVAVAVPASLAPWIGTIDGGWPAHAVAFAGALSFVTVLARLLGARWLAQLPALVVAVLWLTAVAAPGEALLGVVPTRASIAESGTTLHDGIVQVLYAPRVPFEGSPQVVALILLAVLLLVLLVDGMLALGAPALAAAPLLAPASLPIAFRVELDPVWLLPGTAAMIAVLVLGQQEGRIRARAVVAGAAVVVAAMLAPSVLPAPRDVDVDWPAWIEGPATGEGLAAGPPLLSTGIDLGADLRRGSPVRIFDYAPSDGIPSLTRLTSLQGIGSDGFVEERGDLATSFDDLGGTGPGTPITTTFTLGRASIGTVPIPVQATSTSDFSGEWRWDPASQSIGFTDPDRVVSLDGETYEVVSVRPSPIPEGESPATTGAREALEVPEAAASFEGLAAGIVDEDAPPLARARQIEAYLTDDSWEYSETVPLDGFGTEEGGQWPALERFMDARSGYCVHYASAMAILARSAGIPARVSIGFLPGTDPQSDGTYTVTTNDMHAWAELWFDGYGWVPFETTPGVAAGVTVASAEDGDDAGATQPPPTAETTPPSASPQQTPSVDPDAAPTETGVSTAAGQVVREDRAARLALVVLLALLVLATPATVRVALRRRRIAEGAGGALFEVQATLADAGVRVPASSTPGEIAAAVAASPLREREASALDRLRDAAERERFAGEPSTTHAEDARTVIAGIRRTIPRRERLLRTLAPPSLVRVWRRPSPDDAEDVLR